MTILEFILSKKKKTTFPTQHQIEDWTSKFTHDGTCKVHNNNITKFGGTPPKGAKFRIGECVIVRNNENDPLWKGIVVGYFIQKYACHDHLPFVMDANGKVFFVMSAVFPYSDMLWNILQDMSNQEQWDYLLKMAHGTMECIEKFQQTP